MAQLERPTLDGSVIDTYFGWLWAPLSAVDCSPGRRSSPCVAGGSGSCLCCTRSVESPGSRNDARQTETTVVMETKYQNTHVKTLYGISQIFWICTMHYTEVVSYTDSTVSKTRGPWATSLTWETRSNQWIHLSKVMSIFINKLATGFSCRFLNFVKVLCILFLSPNFKRCGHSIRTNLNPLYPGMLFAKFGWNLPGGSIDWRKFFAIL